MLVTKLDNKLDYKSTHKTNLKNHYVDIPEHGRGSLHGGAFLGLVVRLD